MSRLIGYGRPGYNALSLKKGVQPSVPCQEPAESKVRISEMHTRRHATTAITGGRTSGECLFLTMKVARSALRLPHPPGEGRGERNGQGEKHFTGFGVVLIPMAIGMDTPEPH
jgi:hypothetical protein